VLFFEFGRKRHFTAFAAVLGGNFAMKSLALQSIRTKFEPLFPKTFFPERGKTYQSPQFNAELLTVMVSGECDELFDVLSPGVVNIVKPDRPIPLSKTSTLSITSRRASRVTTGWRGSRPTTAGFGSRAGTKPGCMMRRAYRRRRNPADERATRALVSEDRMIEEKKAGMKDVSFIPAEV
jgi:hypothetical protein